MTGSRSPAPYFPVPPADYDQRYFTEVIRAFSLFVQEQRNPGEGRNTFIVLTNLQQNDVGLEPGAVYRQGNNLKIVLLNIAAVAGSSATGSVGSVTVVTT